MQLVRKCRAREGRHPLSSDDGRFAWRPFMDDASEPKIEFSEQWKSRPHSSPSTILQHL